MLGPLVLSRCLGHLGWYLRSLREPDEEPVIPRCARFEQDVVQEFNETADIPCQSGPNSESRWRTNESKQVPDTSFCWWLVVGEPFNNRRTN